MNLKDIQIDLFACNEIIDSPDEVSTWGTFKDSLRAPVHRWFTYPAGFSYKAVEHSFNRYDISCGDIVYDPFMGAGTTNITAKSKGVNSYGVEAHPFVFKITKAKINWNIRLDLGEKFIARINEQFNKEIDKINTLNDFNLADHFPELVIKCYPESTLKELLILRILFEKSKASSEIKEFFFVVITALLRNISSAATGWPYIAPKKAKTTSLNKDVLTEFNKLSKNMLLDLESIRLNASDKWKDTWHHIYNSDSRNTEDLIPDLSVDHVFTSPPYLNNFDYSDRTRLELYFWGEAKNWKDITDNVRTKLITSATTQILRSDPKYTISDDLKIYCPQLADFVQSAADELSQLRKVKGGKKSYDLMVIGYFNDMYKIIKDVFRVLKNNTKALFILGDSAPYGVYIPTDKLIGEIGCCVGFDNCSIEILRKRGDKWKANPQRHHVPLRESIVILEKK
jgi:DNA modification methylase